MKTESIISILWECFDPFSVVKGDITVKTDNNTDVAFRNCLLFSTCEKEINDLLKQTNSANFETEIIKSSLWGYFDAFTLVTGDIAVTADNNADVAFINYASFSACKTEINDLFNQNNSANFEKESI